MNKRVTRDPNILVGKPIIKGTRISVYLILNLIAGGYTFQRVMEAYPELKEGDIKAALEHTGSLLKNEFEFISG